VARQHRRGPVPACSDEQLLAAIAEPHVDGYDTLCTALGLRPHSTTYRRLRERAAALGNPLPAAWSRTGPRRTTPSKGERVRFDTEGLASALSVARTRREVLEFLGVEATGHTYRRLATRLEQEGLDATHLHPHALRAVPLRQLLVADRHVPRTSDLRERLIAGGVLRRRCARCRRHTWEGGPIPLELDHIDGDRTNNLLENLRLLCPNCRALTPTYRGRNIGRSG
jgi:5-methylcytosine-specific restriction endonuclease McrA